MAESKKPAEAKKEKPKAEKEENKPGPKPTEIPAAKGPAEEKAQRPTRAKKEEAPRENLSLDADEIERPKIVKAKGAKNIHTGIAHVYATFNNTIVTIT